MLSTFFQLPVIICKHLHPIDPRRSTNMLAVFSQYFCKLLLKVGKKILKIDKKVLQKSVAQVNKGSKDEEPTEIISF